MLPLTSELSQPWRWRQHITWKHPPTPVHSVTTSTAYTCDVHKNTVCSSCDLQQSQRHPQSLQWKKPSWGSTIASGMMRWLTRPTVCAK